MFKSARIKLTAWYLLIIMLISLTFSAIIYRELSDEVERFERAQRFRIERRLESSLMFPPAGQSFDPLSPLLKLNSEFVAEAKKRILFVLVFINGGILVIAGGFGYFLAGYTLRPIKEMVEEQNRFISDASHELRTPLTSLKSAFEVYLRDKDSSVDEAKKIVYESIDEVNKLQTLSDSLLQLAQFHKLNLKNTFKQVSLNEIIQDSVKKIKPLAVNKEITILEKLQKTHLSGDKYSLTDLLVILLDNSIKYSPSKTKIRIISKKTDGYVEFSIQDEGTGIAQKDIPHIFERFYRADSARSKSNQGGYGLGLSIAKKIVDMHNGTIRVTSKVSEGTTFYVRLPVAG